MRPPWDDDSRWTFIGSRFETPEFLRTEMNRMFDEWIESKPVDDPVRLMWYALPKWPGYYDDPRA